MRKLEREKKCDNNKATVYVVETQNCGEISLMSAKEIITFVKSETGECCECVCGRKGGEDRVKMISMTNKSWKRSDPPSNDFCNDSP